MVMGLLHSLRVVIWGAPPDTKAEQRLLLKIDFFILTYVCLMYWVNYVSGNDHFESDRELTCLRLDC